MSTMAAWKERAIREFEERQKAEEEEAKLLREQAQKELRERALRELAELTGLEADELSAGQWRENRFVIDGVVFYFDKQDQRYTWIEWTCSKCEMYVRRVILNKAHLGRQLKHMGDDYAAYWNHECVVPDLTDDLVPDEGEHVVEIEPPIEVHLAHNQLDTLSQKVDYHDIRLQRLEAFVLQRERQIRAMEDALNAEWAGAGMRLADDGTKSDEWHEQL